MRENRIIIHSLILLGALMLIAATATSASAETLMMPKRAAIKGTQVIIWGVTTQPNYSSTYTMDFGDGSTPASGTVTDGSYITFPYTYSVSGPLTATLTVCSPNCTSPTLTEVASTEIDVYDTSKLSADQLRNVVISMAIQDGLRYLWYNQGDRAGYATDATTYWGNYSRSFTALVVLAFENQGYHLPTDNSIPTGLYEKYVVQRGMNYILDQLQARTLDTASSPYGDPCAVYGPAPCTGLSQSSEYEGYATSLAILPIAASGAMNRTVISNTTSSSMGIP